MNLYHIHKIRNESNIEELYHEGSTFEVGKSFNYMYNGRINRSLTYLDHIEKIDDKVTNIRMPIRNLLLPEKTENLSKEEMMSLLEDCYGVIRNVEMDKREESLEDIRKIYYSDRPSRTTCIWLTDEESLDTWLRILKFNEKNCQLYKVEIDGNLFISTEKLLPHGYFPRCDIDFLSHKYWNPTKEDLENAKDKEYLFEGQLKLVKRVK